MRANPGEIYIPGKGLVNLALDRLQAAATEYDERLVIGRNVENNQWTVYMRMPRGSFPINDDLYPVLGLGSLQDNLPHPDDLKKKLYEMDTVRHGEQLLETMNRKNRDLKKQHEKKAHEASEIAAEGFEWGLRRMSNDIGKRRVQVNMGEPAHRRRPEAK